MSQPKAPEGSDLIGKLSCSFCGQSEGEAVNVPTITGVVQMSALLPVCDGCANVPHPSTAGHPDFVEGMRDGWFGRVSKYPHHNFAYGCGYERGVASRLRLIRKRGQTT